MSNKIDSSKCWKAQFPKRTGKKQNGRERVLNLDAKNWRFLKDGTDDFRYGLPSSFDSKDIYLESYSRYGPPVTSSTQQSGKVEEGGPPHRSHRDTGPQRDARHSAFSKRSPNMQARFDVVERMEAGLRRHPMALYPHLEDCMPQDLFEDVVEILDPEMKLAMDTGSGNEDPFAASHDVSTGESAVRVTDSARAVAETDETSEFTSSTVNNPYLWRPQEEEIEVKDKKKTTDPPKLRSQVQDEEILLVTKAFCEWVASIGGDTNNIEEQTILSLFASGYETKPALSVPIHIVELNNIPPELRIFAMGAQAAQGSTPLKPVNIPPKELLTSDGFAMNSVKQRFGAWYLDPKTWQRRPVDEPLKDPKDHNQEDMSDVRKKSLKLDEDLAPMHGTQLFMEFMNKRETRKPEFLENVSKIQAQQLAEEHMRQEAEKTKQKKLLARQTK